MSRRHGPGARPPGTSWKTFLDTHRELGRELVEALRLALDYIFAFNLGRQSVPNDWVDCVLTLRRVCRAMVDVIRDLHRQGNLTGAQYAVPAVRLVIDTGEEPGGAYDRLLTLFLSLVFGGARDHCAHARLGLLRARAGPFAHAPRPRRDPGVQRGARRRADHHPRLR